jgi:low affinity Fe/Cu permease
MIISQYGQTAAKPLTILDRFDRVAKQTESLTGHPLAFAAAVCFVAIWAMTGPLFHFGESWEFAFISVTTIVTFLMVFLIQNTQGRTRAAFQLKLDELIRSTSGAHNVMLTVEDLSLEEIEKLRTHYEKLATTAREKLRGGHADTSTPEITIR